ncbi:MAG: hypothetical protein WDW38_006668 [Sanguina aurantia]
MLLSLLDSVQLEELVEFLKSRRVTRVLTYDEYVFCYAMDLGKGLLLQQILDLGVMDVDGMHWTGETHLCRAITMNNIELARLLVRFGADVNGRPDGHTLRSPPLSVALSMGMWYDLDMVQLLLEGGARLAWDVGSPGCRHRGHALRDACDGAGVDVVDLLIAYGAEIHAVDGFGDTPLQVAAYAGHRNVALRLIELGADCAPSGGPDVFRCATDEGHDELADEMRVAAVARLGRRMLARVLTDARRAALRRREDLARVSVVGESSHFGLGGLDGRVMGVIADHMELLRHAPTK